ncbi:hypothetical protein RDV78_01995 [Bacillota bacterium LX-D]|nr:hypothetical protein [Bacillota bacterium LX-D]
MKLLKNIIGFFLILIIVGGIGYLGWSYFKMNGTHMGMNMTSDNNTNQNQKNNVPLNTIAIQNKDKMNQALSLINQAIDQITIDPYSQTTVPNSTNGTNQGNGTTNIYPSGNNSINIAPTGNSSTQTPAATSTGKADTNQQNKSYVYDQNALQQVHNGIFVLAQSLSYLNDLNDDLISQAAIAEPSMPTYDTYVAKYNLALQNRTKLTFAMNMLDQASTLINVNPYGSPNGYEYNVQEMRQLHQGIYKLAQGMVVLNRLKQDFMNQMVQASTQAQNTMTMGNQMSMGNNGYFSIQTIFSIILVIMLLGLIGGILGAVLSMIKKNKTEKNMETELSLEKVK